MWRYEVKTTTQCGNRLLREIRGLFISNLARFVWGRAFRWQRQRTYSTAELHGGQFSFWVQSIENYRAQQDWSLTCRNWSGKAKAPLTEESSKSRSRKEKSARRLLSKTGRLNNSAVTPRSRALHSALRGFTDANTFETSAADKWRKHEKKRFTATAGCSTGTEVRT